MFISLGCQRMTKIWVGATPTKVWSKCERGYPWPFHLMVRKRLWVRLLLLDIIVKKGRTLTLTIFKATSRFLHISIPVIGEGPRYLNLIRTFPPFLILFPISCVAATWKESMLPSPRDLLLSLMLLKDNPSAKHFIFSGGSYQYMIIAKKVVSITRGIRAWVY